jgi:hypothetical protein
MVTAVGGRALVRTCSIWVYADGESRYADPFAFVYSKGDGTCEGVLAEVTWIRN